MRDRKNRYDQRDFKYQDQERVPELFEDIYDPIYDDNFSIYKESNIYWNDAESVESVEIEMRWGKIRYKRSDDEGGFREGYVISECAKDEKKHSTGHVGKSNSLPSQSLITEINNRYAILDGEEEEKSWDVIEDKEKPRVYLNRELTALCNDQMPEQENEWQVYHSKYVKKCRRAKKTDKQKWIDSWCNADRKLTKCVADGDTMVINIDGLFRKNRKAGYGVIIRNRYTGVPLVASAAVYERGKPISPVYHELQGLNKGLELAIKYALRHIIIVYSSWYTIARHITYCYGDDTDRNSALFIFCKTCSKRRYFYDCTDEDLELHIYPLIQEIKDKFSMFERSFVSGCGAVKRKYNKAADYLAKLQLNKEEMKPHEFSEKLKDILYQESLSGDLMHGIEQLEYSSVEEVAQERIF